MAIDTLIIIGNGFDIWQGISTSYADFEKYYIAHLPDILKRLQIQPWEIEDEDGTKRIVSDVEMLYGDPFDPYFLDSDFWNRYEDSLALIDDQKVNLYFGKKKEDLKRIALLAENSRKILQEAFSDWIESKNIESKDSGFAFPKKCFVINFNYTNTVRKRFCVSEDLDYHIHGEAGDKESIIVGHASHPEYPLAQLKTLGGRLEGLYYIETVLYESDKHVDDNYQDLALNLAVSGVSLGNLKDVYVLGHSFGEADFGYFYHLAHAMNDVPEDPFEGIPDWCLEYLQSCDDSEAVFLNMQYAIHHRERLGEEGYMLEMPNPDTISECIFGTSQDEFSHDQKKVLEKAAVRARFLLEQGARDAQYEFHFLDMFGEFMEDSHKISKKDRRKFEKQLEKVGWKDCQDIMVDVLNERKNKKPKKPKKDTPKWHISYYSDADKARIEDVMKRIGYSNYKLYSSIEKCIDTFKNYER